MKTKDMVEFKRRWHWFNKQRWLTNKPVPFHELKILKKFTDNLSPFEIVASASIITKDYFV